MKVVLVHVVLCLDDVVLCLFLVALVLRNLTVRAWNSRKQAWQRGSQSLLHLLLKFTSRTDKLILRNPPTFQNVQQQLATIKTIQSELQDNQKAKAQSCQLYHRAQEALKDTIQSTRTVEASAALYRVHPALPPGMCLSAAPSFPQWLICSRHSDYYWYQKAEGCKGFATGLKMYQALTFAANKEDVHLSLIPTQSHTYLAQSHENLLYHLLYVDQPGDVKLSFSLHVALHELSHALELIS